MINYQAIFQELAREIGRRLRVHVDEESQTPAFVLPFKDSMGDDISIRVRETNSHLILDDGGHIDHTLFFLSETTGATKPSRLVSALTRSFDAHYDVAEGLIEMTSGPNEVVPKFLHFTKLLVTLDTMLVEMAREEREMAKPQHESLGPRASQRLKKPLNPLIRAGVIKQRWTISGQTVPDWIVDFAYKPTSARLVNSFDMIVLITVDLAVREPIPKASYAFARAVDIKAAHADYGIRIAYDTHGQNSASSYAAEFLNQRKLDTNAYTSVDMSKPENFATFVDQVGRETGAQLTV